MSQIPFGAEEKMQVGHGCNVSCASRLAPRACLGRRARDQGRERSFCSIVNQIFALVASQVSFGTNGSKCSVACRRRQNETSPPSCRASLGTPLHIPRGNDSVLYCFEDVLEAGGKDGDMEFLEWFVSAANVGLPPAPQNETHSSRRGTNL